MSVRPILQWPDPRLRRAAETVDAITDVERAIWADMIETMDAMPGVGLAAVQIGVMRRLAVVDASQARNARVLLANPEVVSHSEAVEAGTEASPCLPGVSAQITRPRAVRVRFLDADGAAEERDFEGLEARSVQHQIDHLAGKMYFDRLSRPKRDMLFRRARKRAG